MAARIRRWMWVVLGLALACAIGIVALAGTGFYFFRHHVQMRTVSRTSALREFDAVKERFRGQKPLVELDRKGHFLRSNTDRGPAGNKRVPEQLNVLAFDPDNGRVVHLTIPFWLLRLKTGGGSIDFNGNRMDLEDLKLSVEDLEQLGPALIVDHSTTEGKRVLVWSQ